MFGRKERNARSLDRNYIGNYCNLHQRPDLQRLVPRNEKIDFSSYLYKYDRRFRRQGRYFISTNQALYVIDEECVRSLALCVIESNGVVVSQVKVGAGGKGQAAQKSKQQQQEGFTLEYKVKRRIPLESITEIKLRYVLSSRFLPDEDHSSSSSLANIVIISFYSVWIMIMRHCWNCPARQKPSLLFRGITRRKPAAPSRSTLDKGRVGGGCLRRHVKQTFLSSFEYTVKKQGWMGGGTRSVKFAHSATNPSTVMSMSSPVQKGKITERRFCFQNPIDPSKLRKGVDMPRDYEMKVNRSTLTVSISSGLPKQSSNTGHWLFQLLDKFVL